jgi:hypothetical protein
VLDEDSDPQNDVPDHLIPHYSRVFLELEKVAQEDLIKTLECIVHFLYVQSSPSESELSDETLGQATLRARMFG